jgi:hypothetical protein
MMAGGLGKPDYLGSGRSRALTTVSLMAVVRVVIATAGILMLLAPGAARADRSFAVRFTTNDFGSITFAANTLMTCPDSAPTCADARKGLEGGSLGNNNGYAMTYVDVDADPTTFNSSTATLSLRRTRSSCSPVCTGRVTRRPVPAGGGSDAVGA